MKWNGKTDSKSQYYLLRKKGYSHQDAVDYIEGKKHITKQGVIKRNPKRLKPSFSYTSKQAIADGILMKNPRQDRFPQCNIMTRNLYDKITMVAFNRSLTRMFPLDPLEFIGSLMVGANQIYSKKQFKGDEDKNFFVMPKTDEGLIVWFVKNEQGKLTAMLPGDY